MHFLRNPGGGTARSGLFHPPDRGNYPGHLHFPHCVGIHDIPELRHPGKPVHRVPDNLGDHLRGGGNKLRRDLEKDISQQTAHSELTLVCKTPGRSRFRPGVILFMPGLVTLFPAAFRRAPRAVTSAGTTPLPPCAPHCCDKSGGDRQYKKYADKVHKGSFQASPKSTPTQCTRNAITQAIAHCISTVAAAARALPSSLLTVAIAATHGV